MAVIAADGCGRADIDTGMATGFLVAAVGTEFLLVNDEPGLLEFAHQIAQAQQSFDITPVPAQITLRQGMLRECRGGTQIKNQIKGLAQPLRRPVEINGPGSIANLDTSTVRLHSSR